MSVSSIQNQISSVQREIESLHRQMGSEASKEAQKSSRIASISSSIGSSKSSLSTIQSKQREAQRLERDIADIQKKKAEMQKKIADKTGKLHRYQQDLMKEQSREQKRFQDSLQRSHRDQFNRPLAALSGLSRAIAPAAPTTAGPDYDAFISHASEDKDELVRPLAEALMQAEHKIWYDAFSLTVGDSLRKSIDKGLANSQFGIVVLSPDFFAKKWTEYELNGLVAKEMEGDKVILPIWHKVSKDQVLKYSPTLADKLALNTAMFTIDELAQKLGDVITGA